MKLNSIQFCWWQSRWYFPTFFRLTLKTSRCPFYYSSKCSLLEICLGKCELESCSIKSRSEGFTAYIFQIWHIYSKWWWGAAGLFKTWRYGKSEFSDNISQSQVLPEVDRSHLRCHLQPPCLPSLPHAPLPPPSSAAGARATAEVPPYWRLHHASSWPWGGESWPRARPGAVSRLGFGGRQAAARWRKTFFPWRPLHACVKLQSTKLFGHKIWWYIWRICNIYL